MAKESAPIKKVIKTETRKSEPLTGASSSINARKRNTNERTNTPKDFTFNMDNIKWILISTGLVFLGYMLMMGGHMPSPDVWDEKIIYSFRRTVIAPIVILSGLGLAIYSIFRNKQPEINS